MLCEKNARVKQLFRKPKEKDFFPLGRASTTGATAPKHKESEDTDVPTNALPRTHRKLRQPLRRLAMPF